MVKGGKDSIQAERLAKSVADFIQEDFKTRQEIREGIEMASPGLYAFGKTTARVAVTLLPLVGDIVGGVWDIVDGVNDINGSDYAKTYRNLGNEIGDYLDFIDELLKSFKLQA